MDKKMEIFTHNNVPLFLSRMQDLTLIFEPTTHLMQMPDRHKNIKTGIKLESN